MDKPDKRRKYDEAFKTEGLRVARESRSTQAAARALNIRPKLLYERLLRRCSPPLPRLNIRPKLLYEWQKAAQPPLPADPTEAAEVRQLRTANRRLEQELEILKKAITSCLL